MNKTSKEILPESEREELFRRIENNQKDTWFYRMLELKNALLSAEKDNELKDKEISELKAEVERLKTTQKTM